jgi:serine/threonine-protein kinase
VPGLESAPDFHPNRRRRVVIVTALLAFLFAAVGLQWLLPDRVTPANHAGPPPALSVVAVPSATVSVAVVPEPVPEPTPVPSAAPSAPSAQVVQPEPSARPRPTPTSRSKPKTTQKTDCDPPYTIDQEGHRRYKMECL